MLVAGNLHSYQQIFTKKKKSAKTYIEGSKGDINHSNKRVITISVKAENDYKASLSVRNADRKVSVFKKSSGNSRELVPEMKARK